MARDAFLPSTTLLFDPNPPQLPATWAAAWGEDGHGLWQAFEIHGVRQRLRWIPPGTFMMGSSDGEAGRFNDEGPRHEVTISRGYWLFDTPVTQALWEAVVRGENPSRFQSPGRPVEGVSWKDTHKFLATINDYLPELDLSLPSKAQ